VICVRARIRDRAVACPGCGMQTARVHGYHQRTGIVGQAHANGDGRAIMLHQADLDLPELKLTVLANWPVAAAGEVALTHWG
jgi:hypothetical protein